MSRSIVFLNVFFLSIGLIGCLNAKPENLDASHTPIGAALDISYSDFQAFMTPQSSIPYSDSWTCDDGTAALHQANCQNVYNVNFSQADTLSIAVTSVTGTSVVRLAVFGPGSALSGTNLINSSTNDHVCPYPPSVANQDADATVTSLAISSAGTYRIAVGRDWGYSAGAAGTYNLSLTASSVSMSEFFRSVNNQPTLSTGMSCP